MIEEDTDAFNIIPGVNTNVCVKCKRYQTFYSELQIMKVVHEKVGQDYLNNLYYVDPHRESEDKFYTHTHLVVIDIANNVVAICLKVLLVIYGVLNVKYLYRKLRILKLGVKKQKSSC